MRTAQRRRGTWLRVAVLMLPAVAGCTAAGRDSGAKGREQDPAYHMQWALERLNRGQYKEALESIDRALKLKPDGYELHNLRGLILYTAGEPENALEEYERTLELNGYFTDAHNNAGAALAALGRTDEALAEFELVLKDPRYQAREKVYVNMADVHASESRWEEAVADYRRALIIKPDYVGAHFKMGKALLELGRPGEARAAFDEVVRLRPHSDEAREVKQLLASSPASS